MIISRLSIENFKGIRGPASIDFRPITLLFGPNSSGKSTILHALHYAFEILDRMNLDPGKTSKGGEVLDLGGYESLVYKHDIKREIKLKFDLNLQDVDLPSYFEGYEDIGLYQLSDKHILEIPHRAQSAWVELVVKWSFQFNKPTLNRYSVGINGAELATIETSDDAMQVFITNLNPFNPIFLDEITPTEAKDIAKRFFIEDSSNTEEFERLGAMLSDLLTYFDLSKGVPGLRQPLGIVGHGSAIPHFGKVIEFHNLVWSDDVDRIDQGNFAMCLSSLLVGPGELLRDELKRLRYLGPIREIPSRNFLPEKSPDLTRWSSGLMSWDILYKAEIKFIDEVNRWLTNKDLFDTGYRIETKHFAQLDLESPILVLLKKDLELEEAEEIRTRISELPVKRKVTIRENATGISVMPQDIGVGISQVFPVIIGAIHIKDGCFAIEQPELHIHPAWQVTLGDLFISQIQKKALVFLLETHSEHLMLRLLRRIRETDEKNLPPGKEPLHPEQLAVYYVEQGENGIFLSPIRISHEGEFVDRWPKGFFSERMEELF